MKLLKFASIGFLIGFFIVQLSYVANAHNEWDTKTYEVEDFTKIHLEGGYKVILTQGNAPSLKIESSNSHVFDEIDVNSYGELLKLTISKEWFSFRPVTLYITFKDLDKIHIEGGVKLETKGYVDLDDITVHVEGGAKIEMDLKANNVSTISEGGVLFDLEGYTKSLDVKVSGAGHVDAVELKADEVKVKIEGIGTASVHAVETLYAKIEGVGKVRYKGDPDVHKNIEGLGAVTRD